MQTYKPVETGDYNESSEEAKHPGAVLGLIMGIYPAVLIAMILLLFSGIGIRNTFRYIFPNPHPVQRESATPAETLNSEPNQ